MVICKPAIRRTAQVGDWVVGTGAKYSRKAGGGAVDLTDHIIYAMRVSAKMTMQEYEAYAARELPNKKPDWSHSDHRRRLGDAIYSFKGTEVEQLPSVHNKANMKTDLSGESALLSNHFFYWGDQAILLPPALRAIAQNRQGHRVNLNAGYLDAFIDWIVTAS